MKIQLKKIIVKNVDIRWFARPAEDHINFVALYKLANLMLLITKKL